MALRAARYIRVSSEKQKDNTSLEEQLRQINQHCSEHGYITSEEHLYMDILTGIEDAWRDRVDLQRMLEACRHDLFEVAVVMHTDRLGRGEVLIICMEELSYNNVRLESAQQNIEDTDEGKIILHFLSYSSKQEWRRLVRRTKDGKQASVMQKHRILGATPSYGYAWNDDHTGYILNYKVVYVDAEGKEWTEVLVVEFMYDEVKAGTTLANIARKLMKRGIPTRKGLVHWPVGTISQTLKNPIYKGLFTAFRNTFTYKGTRLNRKGDVVANYQRTKKPLEEQYHYPEGTVPAIVDAETWDYTQTRLALNQKTSRRNNRNYENAMCRAGIARCAYCNGSMHVTSETKRFSQYECARAAHKSGKCPQNNNTILIGKLDAMVWDDVCQIIRNPQKLNDHIEALKKPDPTEKDRAPLATRKKDLEEEIENLVELAATAKTEIARKKISSLLEISEQALEVIHTQEKILEGEHDLWHEAQKEIDKFYAWCKQEQEKLETASYQEKRMCLEYLGVTVHVYKYGSKPRTTISYAPPDLMKKLSFVLAQSKRVRGGYAVL